MPSPCLDPDKSPYEKMLEAIEFAETARAQVDDLIAEKIPHVERDQYVKRRHTGQSPATQAELALIAEIQLADVSAFRNAVVNERWGWRLALMYGQQVAIQEQVIGNALLRQLTTQLGELLAIPGGLRRGDT